MGIDLSGIHQSVESDGETTGVTDPDVGEQEKVEVNQDRDNEEDFVEVVTDSGVIEPELALAGEWDDKTADEADQSDIVEPEMELDEEEALVAGNDDEDLESVDAAAVDEPDLGDETSDDELKTGKESEIDDVWADIIEPDGVLDDHLEDELTGDDSETSIDEDLIAAAFESEAAQLADEAGEPSTAGDGEVSDEHYVPPQTEEEMTINMMIDQDIMRLAAEGEEIFTSTIVDDRPDIESKLNVETIVMEGDFVRTALESEALAANTAKGSRRADDAKFPAAGIGDKTPVVRGGQRDTDPPSYGLIAAALVLGLILVGQILHQSREALATVPEFSEVVGPIYRMVGRPLTPAWDVTGWRFEAATSKRDDVDNALIIYARIGNTSVGPLPYPLVHLSLIDLKLEIIGSKVLEPSEYLAGDPDPRKPVAPGDTFDAVIAIESASANADGFKLEACYRLASRQLRCAIPAFK